MEQQDFTGKKNAGHESSEMKNAEKEMPQTKDTKNTISGNKPTYKETSKIGDPDVDSKASNSRINSPSNVVKDRGKFDNDEQSGAYCNIPLAQSNRKFRETAKYRDTESYSNQHHHSIGEGLFLTDDIQDLPPRFRTKVVQALENFLAKNNIKIDRNPLEYFTSYGDASKTPDNNQDKLVYIPPNILEEERKSCENKSDAPSLNANFIEKKNSYSHRSKNYSTSHNSERERQPVSGDNLDYQTPSPNLDTTIVNKSKPPFSRTRDYGTRQNNNRGPFVSQFNMQSSQNQIFGHHKVNASRETSLPPKPFKYHSKQTNSNKNGGNFSGANSPKSSPNTNNTYAKRISVSELFEKNQATLDSKITTNVPSLSSFVSDGVTPNSVLNQIADNNVTVPNSASNLSIDSKSFDKRTFTKAPFENKKQFKSQSQYSALNSVSSYENSTHADSTKSAKYSTNHRDSFNRHNTHTVESARGIKVERRPFQSDKISDKTNTSKYRENNSELFNAQQNTTSMLAKDFVKGNFPYSKNDPSRNFSSHKNKNCDNNWYSKSENVKNYPNKGKVSYNSGQNLNIPPEKEKSNKEKDFPFKNASVQSRHRKLSDSHSSISSSYSSKSFDKVPHSIYSNTQNSSRSDVSSVNSNHNSFESFSHQKPMNKQLDKRGDFNNKKSNHYGYQRDKYSDSSSILSDKSVGNCSYSGSNASNEKYNRKNKHFAKPGENFDEKRVKKFHQNSNLSLKGQEISERKHNSYSNAKYHNFHKTDSNETISNDSKENENTSRLCVSLGFFVKVEVSENVTDLKYWIEYFKKIFTFQFDLERCCRFSDVLILEFERKEHAYTALHILYKQKKVLQNSQKPYFLLISKVLNRLSKPCNCSNKVIRDCRQSIEKHFESALHVLDNKIKEIGYCTDASEKHDSKGEFNSAEFHESKSNFEKFKEHTIAGLEKAEDLRTVQHLKQSFIRECNIFKRCLPIYSKKDEILKLARFHSVSVIVAETGSGKSTQLVEYLLHSPISENGLIICTQPRKLAAISIAQFVSGQMGSAIGKIVGYDVGMEKKCNYNETKIIYMTDYCLLKYLLRNRDLKGVSCIIIDEAHERSLYTDLILGLLKKRLVFRKDLSVLITSATINPTVFVDYFEMPENCVIEVPGRTYPVNVIWYPEDVEIGWDYLEACVHKAYDIHVSKKDGDILVFLTSPSESEEAIYLFKRLLSKRDKKVQLLSLHGKTDIQEQMLIFQNVSKSSRKVIFATNVAETAVTIPGIKYVVDSGMTKELMFDPQKNKSYLAVTFTTKSAAEQRKGRAGRTQSGICYRMYSKRNYAEDMADNAVPEILKSNLQRALLKIFEFGIDPENFNFIEAPPARTISNSVESLELLGAIANKKLTDFGKKLVKLPLEPQLAKLVLQGIQAKIGIESTIIAALLSESGKLFIRNEENREVADAKKRKFCHEGGDLCTYLEIYKQWKEIDIPERYNWCVENFVSFKALSSAAKTVKEILITLRTELGLYVSSKYNNNEYKKQFEKIIFESFSENLCVLSGHPKLGYLSPYLPESFFIHPSSTLSYLGKDSPEFLVYSTLMETSRNYLFDVTPISETTLKSAYQTGKFRLPLHTLRCLQVPPKIMGPFGESVLIRHILGKAGSKIKDLEKALVQLTSVKNLYVNVDVTKGLITVYLSHRLHEKAENHIQQIINKALAEMINEEDIVKLTGTCMYFALSAGGIINDIILPGEFRELVFNRMQRKDSNELEDILQRYGPLQSFSHVTSKQEMQICATFKKVCDAKKAFWDLKQGKKYEISSKPHLPAVNNRTSPMHLLLISWCCRPSTGFGLVELFSEDDLIEASGSLTCKSFFIGNNLIMFQVSPEGKNKLMMKNLPEYVEESAINEKLKENLPHIKIKSIEIHRKPVRITDVTVEETKKKLLKLLSLYVPTSKFNIDLKSPSKESSWKAVVYFDSVADAENTYMKLKDNTCIDSYPLSVRLSFQCHLYCKKNVFDMVSVCIINILRKEKTEGNCNEFSIKLLDGKAFTVQIEFSSKDLNSLCKVKKYVEDFTEGKYMEFIGKSKYHFLFTEGLAVQIKKIQQSTKTLITLDKIKKAISIYGFPDNCQKAEKEIYKLADSQDYSFTRTFNLKDSCIPNGFLKYLYSKYGYDLHGLAVEFKLAVASIDNFGHTLTLKGSKEQIRKVERALEKKCEELFQSRGERQKISKDEEVCPICFDPISYDFQRLEHCGHAFCRQCLLLQLESKIMPLVCVKQDCGKLIFLEDIKRIISFGGGNLKKEFCHIALQHHVSCNIGKLSYCRTPDCPMVYRVTEESSSEYNCPSCKISICTRCQASYHSGMSCEMYQECKKDVDYSLKKWMQENESSRKYCPNCKAVIEKAEGCNHMNCLNCKVHLCWLCLKTFRTGDDVYNHMPYCPKNQ